MAARLNAAGYADVENIGVVVAAKGLVGWDRWTVGAKGGCAKVVVLRIKAGPKRTHHTVTGGQ